MTREPCTTGCNRPVQRAGDGLCPVCLGELLGALDQLVEDLPELDEDRWRQGRRGGRGPVVSGHGERPLLFDAEAVELADVANSTLRTWVGSLRAENPHRRCEVRTAVEAAAWLRSLGGLLAESMEAGQVHDELIHLARAVRRQLDPPAERVYVGVCPECATSLYAPQHHAEAACPGCGASYGVATSLEDRSAALAGITATPAELLAHWRTWSAKPISRASLFRVLRDLQPVSRGRYRVLDVARAVAVTTTVTQSVA